MDEFDNLLKTFDLDFFGKGKHKIGIERALELKEENKALIVDVRAKEEIDYVGFGFAMNIPVSDIPDRVDEIPKDKTVIVFCSACVRAAIVYTYLRLKDYKDVKILTSSLSEIAAVFKPGYVLRIAGNKGSI